MLVECRLVPRLMSAVDCTASPSHPGLSREALAVLFCLENDGKDMLYGLSEHSFPVFPCALQLLCEDKLEGEARRSSDASY